MLVAMTGDVFEGDETVVLILVLEVNVTTFFS